MTSTVPRRSNPCALSAREQEVLEGMAAGRTNAAIGRTLGLTEETVKTHARRLYSKLQVDDRAHAVSEGYRRGLLLVHDSDGNPRVTLPASDEGAAALARALWGKHIASDSFATRVARKALDRLLRAAETTEGDGRG